MQKPIERANHELSSKFFLPQIDDDLDIETPTRKRAGSKGTDSKLKKKQKFDSVGFNNALAAQITAPQSTSTPERLKKSHHASEVSITPANAPFASKITNDHAAPSQKETVKPPPRFSPIDVSLLDTTNDTSMFEEAFKSIDDSTLKEEYTRVASQSFEDWISQGVKLVDKQHDLIKNVVIARVKLNAKFKVIFGAVNEFGEKLEARDQDLKEKLKKLQNLGQEIKAFIGSN